MLCKVCLPLDHDYHEARESNASHMAGACFSTKGNNKHVLRRESAKWNTCNGKLAEYLSDPPDTVQ